ATGNAPGPRTSWHDSGPGNGERRRPDPRRPAMSAGAPTAGPLGRLAARPRAAASPQAAGVGRPWVRLVTFSALAGYALVRWATLMRPQPGWRLLGLLALAVALAGLVPLLARRSQAVAAGATAVIVLLAFPTSGLRWHWLTHLRIAATSTRIENGLSLLPNALVPYIGPDHDVRMVIVLGAAVLVLDAAAVLAFAGGAPTLSDGRRAAAALPLIALAVVPSTLIRPALPYMQGLLLFSLLAAFMWGERVRAGAAASAVGIVALAGVAAAIMAPRIDRGAPWVNYRAWAGSTVHAHVDTFDWNQTYGPLHWPQSGHEVLTVQAARFKDYWKAEDLDTFNGYSWVAGTRQPQPGLPAPAAAALARWTQRLRVSLVGMKTADVIAAGEAAEPSQLPRGVAEGSDPGTWQTSTAMGPGTSYVVSSYSPHPTPHQLATAGRQYPESRLENYLTLELPHRGGSGISGVVPVTFPLFHSRRRTAVLRPPVAPATGAVDATEIRVSPYAPAYALARQLARRARTPYAFVMSVRSHLSGLHGFTYTQSPPRRRFPLESFLFSDRRGYCQQFSGAMALLLRMGGIPARVASGFTPGTYDQNARRWMVADIDAHAWVEAWFPAYGWVRFDPTPTTAPARGGVALPSILKKLGGAAAPGTAAPRRDAGGVTTVASNARHRSHGGASAWWPVAVIAGLVLVLGLMWLLRRVARGHVSRADLLSELERALARTGRPLSDGVTLAGLERRLHSSPEAEAYVRTLRLSRYGGGADSPSAAQRRALRRELGRGLGFIGRVRALWALPPRPRAARRRAAGARHLPSQ
ncbi:MAG: transglutaminase family protein, partial [Solirubrobacteraceae bacterium]